MRNRLSGSRFTKKSSSADQAKAQPSPEAALSLTSSARRGILHRLTLCAVMAPSCTKASERTTARAKAGQAPRRSGARGDDAPGIVLLLLSFAGFGHREDHAVRQAAPRPPRDQDRSNAGPRPAEKIGRIGDGASGLFPPLSAFERSGGSEVAGGG